MIIFAAMDLSTPADCTKAWFESDPAFHALYPPAIRQMARRHWTPLKVARLAAAFLRTSASDKILDIGSGAGKFCLTAAFQYPDTQFFGIEQRPWLVEEANGARRRLGLTNVHFQAANLTETDLRPFTHFYFYNSFYENLATAEKIDQDLPCSLELFDRYSYHLYKHLRRCPAGTRLVTYHSLETEIPRDFHLVRTEINDYLKCWIKV